MPLTDAFRIFRVQPPSRTQQSQRHQPHESKVLKLQPATPFAPGPDVQQEVIPDDAEYSSHNPVLGSSTGQNRQWFKIRKTLFAATIVAKLARLSISAERNVASLRTESRCRIRPARGSVASLGETVLQRLAIS